MRNFKDVLSINHVGTTLKNFILFLIFFHMLLEETKINNVVIFFLQEITIWDRDEVWAFSLTPSNYKTTAECPTV